MKKLLLYTLTVVVTFALYLMLLKNSPEILKAEVGRSVTKSFEAEEEGIKVLAVVQPLWCGEESGSPFTHGTYFELQDGTALFPNNSYEIKQSKYKPGQWVEIEYSALKDGIVSLSCTPKSGSDLLPVMVNSIKEVKNMRVMNNKTQPEATFSVSRNQ